MNKELLVGDKRIPYNIRLSRKAGKMRISVGCETGVVVTCPGVLSRLGPINLSGKNKSGF